MKRALLAACLISVVAFLSAQEAQRESGATVYHTAVNDDRVNVRQFPSLASKVLFRLSTGRDVVVTGISKTSEIIGGHEGYWLRIEVTNENDIPGKTSGWIYGRYVKGGARLMPSAIRATGFEPATKDYGPRLSLQVERGTTKLGHVVYPHKVSTQYFHTFTWTDEDSSYRYTDVPGTYAWYPETNRIEHITYLGSSAESAWVSFTDDFQYMLQDFGTGPGIRELEAWNLKKNERVYSGSYYDNPNISQHEIDIVFGFDVLRPSDGNHDPEALNRARDYMRKHPIPPERSDGLANTLIVIFTIDLDSGNRRYRDCEYIVTQ